MRRDVFFIAAGRFVLKGELVLTGEVRVMNIECISIVEVGGGVYIFSIQCLVM